MSRRHRFSFRPLIAGLCLALAAVTASATTPPQTEQGQLVHKIVYKWGQHVQEAYGADVHAWAESMTPLLIESDLDTLRKAADARTFDAMNNALLGDAAPQPMALGGEIAQLALGAIDEDLTLVPVTPCRLFDTRLAGGPIPALGTREFDITDVMNYTAQGGANHNCHGVGEAGSFAAAVINFTVVDPSTGGYIVAYPVGVPRPEAATVNYNANQFVSNNLAVVRLDQGAAKNELAVHSFARVHLVADIVGYFAAPKPTALECLETAGTVITIQPGESSWTNTEACPTGFTRTSTSCDGDSKLAIHSVKSSAPQYGGGPSNPRGICAARNTGTAPTSMEARAMCCRVPGR